MGVGAPHRLDPPVQIEPHGALLAGGLGVEVHQTDIRVQTVEQPVRHGKRVVKIGVHLAPPDEVHHRNAQPPGAVVDPQPPAGDPAGVIGGTEEPGRLREEVLDLDAVPGVVPQGYHVGPGVVNGPGLPGQDAHAGGVFPVDHGKMDVVELLQGAKMARQKVQSLLAHHIAHGQYVEYHIRPSPNAVTFIICDFRPKSETCFRRKKVRALALTSARWPARIDESVHSLRRPARLSVRRNHSHCCR